MHGAADDQCNIPSVIELGAGLGAGWKKGWGGSQAAPRQFHIENVIKTNDFGAGSQNIEIWVGWELGPELGSELGTELRAGLGDHLGWLDWLEGSQ